MKMEPSKSSLDVSEEIFGNYQLTAQPRIFKGLVSHTPFLVAISAVQFALQDATT